jgi:glycerate kinase
VALTGEGRVDEQTAFGKTVFGVARRAREANVGCICFCGGATPEGIAALSALGAVVVPAVERPMSLDEAIAAGGDPIVRAAERAARLVSLRARARD